MADKNGNGVWKSASTHLAVIIVTGGAAWFSFGGGIRQSEAEKIAIHAAEDAVGHIPSRSEVSKMIQTESPYTLDKSGIEARLKNIEETVTRIDRRLSE